MLEVSSWKDAVYFGKKEMLASRYMKHLANINLHVPLEEIKVDKTLHFVEEPVEIIDREVKSLKRGRISIVKVHWNSKRGHEDFMKIKYPHLLVDQAIVIKFGYIGLQADFSAPLNVLSSCLMSCGVELWIKLLHNLRFVTSFLKDGRDSCSWMFSSLIADMLLFVLSYG
ncbi:hypothetical protein Tco_0564316 [Tanacetum coccineum]